VLKDTDGELIGKIHRGGKAYFNYTSNFLVCKVNQFRDTVRALKLKKTKKDKLPKDSLAIWLFNEDKLLKFPRVKSFNIAEENSNWVLYQLEKPVPPKKDTSEAVTDSTKAEEQPPAAEETKTEENKVEETKPKVEKSEEIGVNKELSASTAEFLFPIKARECLSEQRKSLVKSLKILCSQKKNTKWIFGAGTTGDCRPNSFTNLAKTKRELIAAFITSQKKHTCRFVTIL
jgi:hypothetical protein